MSAAPAAADITAHYRRTVGPPREMIVRVNDRGDSRISVGSTAVLTIDGISYVVVSHPSGDFAVRQDELLAEVERQQRARFPPGPVNLRLPADRWRAVEHGRETVGGRTGTRWILRSGDEAHPDDEQFVISRDLDLAPLGRALAAQFEIATFTISLANTPEGRLGWVPSSLHREIAAGTVIRVGRLLSLRRVKTQRIRRSAFVLPETILPPDQFLARASWIRPHIP